MVVFHKSSGGCVEVVFRMEENEEIPSIDQLIKEMPEFFEEEEEVNEFDEFSL